MTVTVTFWSQTWRFWRWFSFSNRWSLGSMLIFRGILPEWMEDQLWMESSRVFKLMAFFWLAHRFTDRSCFKTLWLVVFLEGPWATKHRSLFFLKGWMKDPLSVIWLVHFGQKDWRFTIQATNNVSLKILEDLESSNLQSRYPWRPPPAPPIWRKRPGQISKATHTESSPQWWSLPKIP